VTSEAAISTDRVIARVHIGNIASDGVCRVAHQESRQRPHVIGRYEPMFGRLVGGWLKQFIEMVEA
jgi:hypothetical protein